MFPARIADLSAADIDNLFVTEAAESIDLEFKRELPNDGRPDPWMTGGRIGDRAKDELAIEIGAFANTTGGTLIVGIDEEPLTKVARRPVQPIPNCKQAAAILHQSLTARIEPRLPVFECEGIVTEQDGTGGVVVLRALKSYLAPHRNTKDNNCYVRRNDRAEPMSMLEIQEMTRRVASSTAATEKSFTESSERFFAWIPDQHRAVRGLQGRQSSGNNPQYMGGWATRLTAIPMRPLTLGTLSRQPWLQGINLEPFDGAGRQGMLRPYDLEVTRAWVPRLRAVERTFHGDWLNAVDRIYSDGRVERFASSIGVVNGMRPQYLHLGVAQFMWHSASVIRMVDIVRAHADRPTQDFALDMELINSDPMHMDGYPGPVPMGIQRLPEGHITFPRYEIGEREGFNDLLTTIDADLWNAVGHQPNWEIAVDWPLARP